MSEIHSLKFTNAENIENIDLVHDRRHCRQNSKSNCRWFNGNSLLQRSSLQKKVIIENACTRHIKTYSGTYIWLAGRIKKAFSSYKEVVKNNQSSEQLSVIFKIRRQTFSAPLTACMPPCLKNHTHSSLTRITNSHFFPLTMFVAVFEITSHCPCCCGLIYHWRALWWENMYVKVS